MADRVPKKRVTAAAPPELPGSPPVSDVSQSYIAGDAKAPYFNQGRALPQTIDEAEQRFGIGIYTKMLRSEPYLQTVHRILKTRVWSEGMTHQSACAALAAKVKQGSATAEEQTDHDNAAQVLGYIQAVYAALGPKRLKSAGKNLVDAGYLGHKLAEVTFGHFETGPHKGKMLVSKLACKPRENYTFVLGPANEFLGVIAKVPGQSIMVWQGLVGDLSAFPNAIDPDKLLVLNFEEEDGNVQGLSWFRACYAPWKRKADFVAEEFGAGVSQAAGRIAVVLGPANRQQEVVDAETGLMVRIETAVLKAVRSMQSRNGGTAVLPTGSTLSAVAPSVNEGFFDTAIGRCDKEMVTAYILSARAVMEAKHGSKADSDSATDILDELVMAVRDDICDLFEDLNKRLVRMSFGDEWAEKYTPRPTMQKASRPDFAANATAVAALQSSGYLDPSQQPMVDAEILGIDARNPAATTDSQDDEQEPDPDQEVKPKEAVPFRGSPTRAEGAVGRGLPAGDGPSAIQARGRQRAVRDGRAQC